MTRCSSPSLPPATRSTHAQAALARRSSPPAAIALCWRPTCARIARAVAREPVPPRRRDFRIDPAQAAQLRGSRWSAPAAPLLAPAGGRPAPGGRGRHVARARARRGRQRLACDGAAGARTDRCCPRPAPSPTRCPRWASRGCSRLRLRRQLWRTMPSARRCRPRRAPGRRAAGAYRPPRHTTAASRRARTRPRTSTPRRRTCSAAGAGRSRRRAAPATVAASRPPSRRWAMPTPSPSWRWTATLPAEQPAGAMATPWAPGHASAPSERSPAATRRRRRQVPRLRRPPPGSWPRRRPRVQRPGRTKPRTVPTARRHHLRRTASDSPSGGSTSTSS